MARRKLTLVVGARPNFMKAAPLASAIKKRNVFDQRLVHTGQHFDPKMSDVFFQQLGLIEPSFYMNINQTTPVNQIGNVILGLEREFAEYRPDLVVVFGDVNSTMAAAIAANKMDIKLAHVEAGLRSFDRSMPEEHNRMVADALSDFLFTPSPDADENLVKEGVARSRIFRVGNIMVDSLLAFKPVAENQGTYQELGLAAGEYALVTLHRPSNVDDAGTLRELVQVLAQISGELPVAFPIHPRTRSRLEDSNLLEAIDRKKLILLEPLSYVDFLNLMINARIVLTDSGGIQEETTVLGIRCLTLRRNTERPITISHGTNLLAGTRPESIRAAFDKAMDSNPAPAMPDLWDGKTAERILDVLEEKLDK
jgi:UDP-N-acetylglucosamine 2-epimerase (non-hydrolysing)